MTSSSSPQQEATPLWSYVPIADYTLPSAPVTDTARKGLAQLVRFLGRDDLELKSLLKAEDELQTLTQRQLDLIAPVPDWSSAVKALGIELEGWLHQSSADQQILFLIGPPYSGITEVVSTTAEQQSWRLLNPPSLEQIWASDDKWFTDLSDDNTTWVLPALEKVYLRHVGGLDLIRRFLDRAFSSTSGRGIISCDSWAWAYLRQIWHGRQPVPLTLQAFDAPRLAKYIQNMADSAYKEDPHFRQADNGDYILPPQDADEASFESSNYLTSLAAHSRGIFGVAWAVWRAILRAEPDELMSEQSETDRRQHSPHAFWVTPWDQLKHPSLPDVADHNAAFVLHTLLLHAGLPLDLLLQLLPLSPNQTMETLFWLEKSGLVNQTNSVWQVTALGYPAVRQFLQTNGYLVDRF